MPGGKIVFYSGLITRLSLNDDEIAVVMGHEVAHALHEHSREQLSQAMVAQTVIGVGAAWIGFDGGTRSGVREVLGGSPDRVHHGIELLLLQVELSARVDCRRLLAGS